MASAAKALGEFSGKEQKDINIRLKECDMICIVAGLNELRKGRPPIIKLRRDARFWCSEGMKVIKWQMDMSNLNHTLKLDFSVNQSQ